MNAGSDGLVLGGAIGAGLRGEGHEAARAAATIRAHAGAISVFVQLVLVAFVIRHVDLFTSALRRTIYLAVAGFLVNHFLPKAYRLRAFAVLCGVALLIVMGGSPDVFWDGWAAVYRSAAIVAVGALLVGICLLPIGFWTRAVLLGGAGAIVAWCRVGGPAPASMALIWPVLAGFLMFRLAIFLYSLDALKGRPKPAEVFAYFSMVPNVGAGFFPVVDYRTFLRSHYDTDAVAIYQRGMRWIVRGVTQLIAYRIVQQLFAIAAGDVASGRQLVQFVLANSFLYLNVSGQFHVFTGLLLLFGFNLPETHRRYFLASSFTDYWRRVNVYWKDFILTVFYYPAYFRLKNRGATFALVVATLWSFFMTWALHLYQTWWLKGSAAITAPDVLFWSILALLVLVNSLRETRRGRQRRLGSTSFTSRQAAALVLRTVGTFAVISVLWSLWSAPTLTEWIGLWRFADRSSLAWGAAALVPIAVATILFEVLPVNRKAAAAARGDRIAAPGPLWRGFAQCAVPLVAIYIVVSPAIQAKLDAAALQPWYDAVDTGDSLRGQLVSRNGGYYEHLLEVDLGNQQLWETLTGTAIPVVYQGADPRRPVADFRFLELLPNVHEQAYLTDFATNRWGMRDRDYPLEKPARTIRVALIGSSHVMGFGVPADRVFKAVFERRLNAGAGPADPRVEVLNFGMSGLSPLGDVSMVREGVARFQPDFVLVVMHPSDYAWVNRDLSRAVRQRIPLDDFLQRVVREARIAPTTHEAFATERLTKYEPALLAWAYRRTAAEVRAIGAIPLGLFLPVPENLPLSPAQQATAAQQKAFIARAGFVLLDFTSVFDHMDPQQLMLPEPTHHSNVRAHAIIADALYRAFETDPRVGFREKVTQCR